jgi:hypothetical protein
MNAFDCGELWGEPYSSAVPMANLCRCGEGLRLPKPCLVAFLGIHTRENGCSLELTTITAASSLTINRNTQVLRNHEYISE